MGREIGLRPREDIEYVLPYLDEVERLVRVASTLPSSPDKDEVLSAVLGRIMVVLAALPPEWGPGVWKFSSPPESQDSGGIKLGGDVEIHGNVLEPPVRPAENLEECRRHLQQVMRGLDPGRKFLTVEQDNDVLLVVRWKGKAGTD